uniref:Uncharacterized protein n=1 Tax=Anguilla anguilla TaxID=7936 RepID=A0A0E9XLG7_ANGAN
MFCIVVKPLLWEQVGDLGAVVQKILIPMGQHPARHKGYSVWYAYRQCKLAH